jgi:hypothetical protein
MQDAQHQALAWTILLQEKVDQGLASHRRQESFGGVTNDGSNRDEVAEGKRAANYKSVISGA